MLALYRTKHTQRETLGIVCFNGLPLFFTLEPPWNNNQENVSCIPTGVYRVAPVLHDDFGHTLLVQNVLRRTGIYFHCGNLAKETNGCILVGDNYEPYNERIQEIVMYNSRKTFDRYMPSLCQLAPTDLQIINVDPHHYYGDRYARPLSEKV